VLRTGIHRLFGFCAFTLILRPSFVGIAWSELIVKHKSVVIEDEEPEAEAAAAAGEVDESEDDSEDEHASED
jgi:hypothetical protein